MQNDSNTYPPTQSAAPAGCEVKMASANASIKGHADPVPAGKFNSRPFAKFADQCFVTDLVDVPLPDGKHWRLYKPLVWQWRDGTREIVPRDFVTDYASVPDLGFFAALIMAVAFWRQLWPLFWVAWLVCVFAKRIDDDPLTDPGSAFHDQDYFLRNKPRWRADWNLAIRMRAMKVGWIKCALYWFNLRLFGWTHWYFGRHAKTGGRS